MNNICSANCSPTLADCVRTFTEALASFKAATDLTSVEVFGDVHAMRHAHTHVTIMEMGYLGDVVKLRRASGLMSQAMNYVEVRMNG